MEQQELTLQWNYPGYSDPEASAETSLGSTQEQVLEYIKGHPRCTQAAIVKETGKHKSEISKVVGQLVERGLVIKKDGALMCLA